MWRMGRWKGSHEWREAIAHIWVFPILCWFWDIRMITEVGLSATDPSFYLQDSRDGAVSAKEFPLWIFVFNYWLNNNCWLFIRYIFFYSFNSCLLNAYCISCTDVGTWETTLSNKDKYPCPHRAYNVKIVFFWAKIQLFVFKVTVESISSQTFQPQDLFTLLKIVQGHKEHTFM